MQQENSRYIDEYYMMIALNEAEKAIQTGDVPIGAVIVSDGSVLAKGRNRKEKTGLATRHAEIVAIEKAEKKLGAWRLSDSTLYVTLEPCLMCAGAIQQARVKRVVFGAFDRKGGAYGSITNVLSIQGLNHYPEVACGILEAQCSELLSNFFLNLRQSKQRGNRKV